MLTSKIDKSKKRKYRVRAKIFGTNDRPRLSVFRSNQHIFVQLVDDNKGVTLVSSSDTDKLRGDKSSTKRSVAFLVGEDIAKKALAKKIKKVVFDKGGYRYHGRVKEVSDGARKGGLEF